MKINDVYRKRFSIVLTISDLKNRGQVSSGVRVLDLQTGGLGLIPLHSSNLALSFSSTSVVIEWTSPLVCLPIYTQKVGRRVCLCLCGLSDQCDGSTWCRQVQYEKPFSGAPAVHS